MNRATCLLVVSLLSVDCIMSESEPSINHGDGTSKRKGEIRGCLGRYVPFVENPGGNSDYQY